MVRLPNGMRDRLKQAADASGRSANAEIVARLEESFEDRFSMREMQVALLVLARFTRDRGASTLDEFIASLEAKQP